VIVVVSVLHWPLVLLVAAKDLGKVTVCRRCANEVKVGVSRKVAVNECLAQAGCWVEFK